MQYSKFASWLSKHSSFQTITRKKELFNNIESICKRNFENVVNILISGFDKTAALLIQKGADINIVGESGQTALMTAIDRGKQKAVSESWLIDQSSLSKMYFSRE